MPVKSNHTARRVFLIFVIGLLLRLGYCLFIPQMEVLRGDAASYSMISENLLTKNSYTLNGKEPNILWAPGYPFFISGIYKVFGLNQTAVRVVQSVLGALVILMVYSMGSKVFNNQIGILSAAITAIYPGFIGYCGLFVPQALAMFLIVLFIFIILKFSPNINFGLSLILGLIAGYSSLVRAELFLFWSLLLLMMVFIAGGDRKVVKASVIIFITMCFVVSLWAARNYKVFGRPVLISVHYGDLFWYSTWKGEWLEYRPEGPYQAILEKGLGPVDTADLFFKAGLNNIKEHPFIYLKMCSKRLYRFWLTGHSNIFYFMQDSLINYFRKKDFVILSVKLIMLLLNGFLILTGFLGIRAAYKKFDKKRGLLFFLLFPVAFFVILHFFLFATPRYAIPVMPFMILFSSLILSGRAKINGT